jgi:hypothetical protein
MDTPTQQLAAKILERLIAEGLLTKNDQKKLVNKLADGKLTSEDWRLAVELAASKEVES